MNKRSVIKHLSEKFPGHTFDAYVERVVPNTRFPNVTIPKELAPQHEAVRTVLQKYMESRGYYWYGADIRSEGRLLK